MTHHTITFTRPTVAPRPPEAIAYALFRAYAKTCTDAGYRAPAIRSEADLVDDLNEAMDKALQQVQIRQDLHADFDYLLGYATGFVLGNLMSLWYAKYVAPHSWKHKAKIALDAVIGYAKFDEVLAVRLQALYEGSLSAKPDAPADREGVRLTDVTPEVPVVGFHEGSRATEHPTETTDRFEGVLQNLRSLLIDEVMHDPKAGALRVEDVDGQLKAFVAKWLSYAVSGVVFEGDLSDGR